MGAAVGLGFLMKGPVALAVPAVVLVPVWRREGVLTALRVRDVVVAAGVFAVVGLPWYAAMTVEHGTAYLESFFVGDNLERFATDRFNAPRAIWFYVPIVIGGMMPWSAFLLVLPARSLFAVVRRHRLLAAEEWKLLLWALMPLLLFTLSIGQAAALHPSGAPPLGHPGGSVDCQSPAVGLGRTGQSGTVRRHVRHRPYFLRRWRFSCSAAGCSSSAPTPG